jgi:hypothetical protein
VQRQGQHSFAPGAHEIVLRDFRNQSTIKLRACPLDQQGSPTRNDIAARAPVFVILALLLFGCVKFHEAQHWRGANIFGAERSEAPPEMKLCATKLGCAKHEGRGCYNREQFHDSPCAEMIRRLISHIWQP